MTIPVISLFSGAGGLDLGAEDAGARVRVCVESDIDSAKTLMKNNRFFPQAEVIDRPIETVSTDELLERAGLASGDAALVIGGPPCQPFSKSGYWLQDRRLGAADPRNLLAQFMRVVQEARPGGFLFENVPSLLHPANRPSLEALLATAEDLGYATRVVRLQAADYGVPQARMRLLVLGVKGRVAPRAPRPTHWWGPTDPTIRRKLSPPETAGAWIASFDADEYKESGEVADGRWAEELAAIPPGMNYKFLTAWAGHPEPKFITETKYWSFLLKLSPRRPSWTIQAQPGPWTGPFHWSGRRLRLVERAALQSFPPTYRFEGERTSRKRQIGNAVPPLLASRVVTSLLTDIIGSKPRPSRRLRYRLSPGFDFDEERFGDRHHPRRGRQW